MWLITAYFPNSLKKTVATTRAVDAMLCQKHGARIILAGDFNSTETTSRSSTGGLLEASNHRTERAACVQQLLDKWRLKDGWMTPGNPHRNREGDNLTHLTHWNHERTRGVRIDRVYSNFEMVGATMEVSTITTQAQTTEVSSTESEGHQALLPLTSPKRSHTERLTYQR